MNSLNYINQGNAAFIDSLAKVTSKTPNRLILGGRNFLKDLILVEAQKLLQLVQKHPAFFKRN